MLMLSGFELHSRWVPLPKYLNWRSSSWIYYKRKFFVSRHSLNQKDSLISDYQRSDCTNSHYIYLPLKSPARQKTTIYKGSIISYALRQNVIRSDDKRSRSIFVTLTCEG